MYPAIFSLLTVVFVAETLGLLYLWTRNRSGRTLAAAILAALGIMLLATPESTVIGWVAGAFGEAGFSLAAALSHSSWSGALSYGILALVIPAVAIAGNKPSESRKTPRRKR